MVSVGKESKFVNIYSRAVHTGDRKNPGDHVPVTTPIHTAASYFYEDIREAEAVFANERSGYVYARYDNPTNAALEELVTSLEGGAGTLATSSGMAAIHIALTAALLERPKSVLCATAIYGATVRLLHSVLEPFGVEINFVDICDLEAVRKKVEATKPGAILMETVSNPVLRVGELDKIAEMAKAAGAALVVDNTFTTPLLVRPLEWGANIVVHSATKYLSGHGDVLGGFVTSDADHYQSIRALSRAYGPTMGPFEAYLSMRGIKTFPLRMERQCQNAIQVAAWLRQQPGVERVFFTDDPAHPEAEVIKRLMPNGLYGAMLAFELRDAGREQVYDFMNRLKLIVPATSLGDVHTMMLYPVMASHRDLSPKQRERMGIRENLVRLSVGIECVDDIKADLAQALR